jgi:hypothetical protein
MDTPEWIEYQLQFDLPAEYFQEILSSGETTTHCVIIEPRPHPRLILVIKNFMYLLQKKGWGLLIYHSSANESMLKEGLAGWPNVHYIPGLTNTMTVAEYNETLCTPDFWHKLIQYNCRYALIFQVNTVLLKDNIDDFTEYDYVGATGGLSLRNVFRMWLIARGGARIVKTPFGEERFLRNEDAFFRWHLENTRTRLADPDVEKQFSISADWAEDPLSIHNPCIGRFPSYDAFARLLSRRYNPL